MPRPREPLIERDRAVRVALDMIDEEGLAAFSLEKLSRKLGVKGPSLYHHFTDRADLLAHVAELILFEVPDVFAEDSEFASLGWDRRLLQATIEFRRAVRRHHNAGPVLLEHYPRGLMLRNYERAVAALEEAEVPSEYHALLIDALEKLAVGFGLSRPTVRLQHGIAFPEFSAAGFPALSRAVDASPYDEESLFEAACVALLAGVKAQVAAAAPGRRKTQLRAAR
jgi:AcrR family transcriptional regulator